MASRIAFDRAKLEAFCKAHHIRRLSLFGSVLREDFRPDSDVDVLVEFEEGRSPGLMAFCTMEDELARLFGGRRLDLVTPKFLNHRIRDRVLAEAEVEHSQG